MSIPAVVPRVARLLPPGILVEDVAATSRAALVAFLRLAEGDRERGKLAAWLFGAYLDALRIGADPLTDERTKLVVDVESVQESAAEQIATTVRVIERVLVAFYEEPDLSIATQLVDRRVVEPIVDHEGHTGFAPLGGEAMPLNVRVLSLATAEMLTRPERLRADLLVEATSIDIADRPALSGVGVRFQTLPWAPADDERDRVPGWPGRALTLAELAAAQDDHGDPGHSQT